MDVLDLLMHMLLQATPTTYATAHALTVALMAGLKSLQCDSIYVYSFIHSLHWHYGMMLWVDL